MRILLLFATILFSPNLIAQSKNDSIQPISSCVSELFVPNVFSGSGDSVNDIFLPRLEENRPPMNLLFSTVGAKLFLPPSI